MIRKLLLAALLSLPALAFGQGTISSMTAASALSGTELFECVQSGSKKCTAAQIKTFTSASPTLVTPALGTPSSGTLTNATGLPPAGVVGTAATLGPNTFTGPQTITQASANAGILASTGYSLTGSDTTSMVNLAGTWNTSGTPSLIKANVTDTASNAASLLLDLQVGGTTKAALTKTGSVYLNGRTVVNASSANSVDFSHSSTQYLRLSNGSLYVYLGNYEFDLAPGFVTIKNSGAYSWISGPHAQSGTRDLFLTRSAAATLQLGAADAASPVAQTLQAQGSRSGTDTNVAGANLTVQSGAGTGNAPPSSLIFKSYTAVASGTGAQTATTALTLTGANATVAGTLTVGGLTSGRVPFASTSGLITDSAALTYDTSNQRLRVTGITSTSGQNMAISGNPNAGITMAASNTVVGTGAYGGFIAAGDTASSGLVSYSSGFTTAGLKVANGSALFSSGGQFIAGTFDANPLIVVTGGSAASNEALRILGAAGSGSVAGNIGIGAAGGVTNPTAYLHIKAGTATAGTGPLKLTSGTNLTTPENGTFEYDGTNLYFTTGGTRKTVTLTP